MPNNSPNKPLKLVVRCGVIPSFKNRKRLAINSTTGKPFNYTDKSTKKRMQVIESSILSALYSLCQTENAGTGMECQRPLLIALSERLKDLTDDSLNQIPCGSFETRMVARGMEGVEITIEELS